MKTKIRISLSILIIAAFFIPTSIAFAVSPQTALHFRLQANAGWVDSGFAIEANQPVTITAYGQAITAPIKVFGPGSVSGPNGQIAICPNYEGAPPCAMDYAPYGALVGKIGVDGEPFLIGSNFEFTPASGGDLYLAVNDLLIYYSDNYGNYMVFFNK